jgi:hypothetical protein
MAGWNGTSAKNVIELKESHQKKLLELARHGYEFVAFPLYPSHVGVKKGNCGALLAATPDGHWRIFGQPSWLVAENVSVLVRKAQGKAFVWKEHEVAATEERLAELARFVQDLEEKLAGIQ